MLLEKFNHLMRMVEFELERSANLGQPTRLSEFQEADEFRRLLEEEEEAEE